MSIALILVLARTVIRLRLQKRLFVEDAFLFLGVMCLCASVAFVWRFSTGIFKQEEVLNEPLEVNGVMRSYLIDPIDNADNADNADGVYIVLIYITIYFVKLSFLFFFRNLVRRDRKMTIYWWTVLAIMIVALFVSILIVVVPLCAVFPTPHSTLSLSESCFYIWS